MKNHRMYVSAYTVVRAMCQVNGGWSYYLLSI